MRTIRLYKESPCLDVSGDPGILGSKVTGRRRVTFFSAGVVNSLLCSILLPLPSRERVFTIHDLGIG